jgi:hypothetical protein
VNDEITDMLGDITSRTVTVRAADGRTVVETKAVNLVAAGVAAILIAPRLAAAAALGALFAGVSVAVEKPAPAETI